MYYLLNSSFGLLGWIVIIVLFVSQHKRIVRLERDIRALKKTTPVPENAQATAQSAVTVAQTAVQGQPHETSETASGPDISSRFIAWLKDDWLLKLGVLLLLIGFGWLVTYAFMNNWIGPMGRIAFGLVCGAGILAFGWIRMNKYVSQGGIFVAFGATVILLSIFAAREIYGFFTPLTALSVMFLCSAFVALASVKFKTEALALLSIILGAVAPLLTKSPTHDYVALYWYLLVLIAGVVWIVALTGWRSLTFASLLVFAVYSVQFLTFSNPVFNGGSYYYGATDPSVLLLFEYAVAAILFLVTILAFIRKSVVHIVPDMITAGCNGLLLLMWILSAAPQEWKSLLIIAWMLVFVIGGFIVFRTTGARQPFYIYAAVGITMLASATSVQLEGHTLVIAYAFEAVAVTIATYLVLRDVIHAERTTVLMLVPALLSVPSFYARTWWDSVFHKDFAVLFIMSILLFFLGLFFRWLHRQLKESVVQKWYPTLIITGSGYAFILVWLALHAAIDKDDTATTLSLFIYTVVGLSTYFVGKFQARHIMQYYGGILLGLVVLRLLIIDVWGMALSGRIITFFLVGAMLIGTAFVGRRSSLNQVATK